jgi:hypothetical protein
VLSTPVPPQSMSSNVSAGGTSVSSPGMHSLSVGYPNSICVLWTLPSALVRAGGVVVMMSRIL